MTLIQAVNGGGTAGLITPPAPIVFHSREPDPSWVRRLREISPISDTHSWLDLRWFAEAERWCLYEMVPNDFIDQGMRAELEGAHPDTLEDWARIVSAYQWTMYRKYRVHARPSWIIQGFNGGHKVAFDKADEELCRAQGLPTQPPKPGALPYAPFDERVVRQILRMSKLTKVKGDLAEFKRRFGNTEGHKREYRNALQEARKQYVDFISGQFAEPAEHFIKAERVGELDNAPRTSTDWQKMDEFSDHKYIETGRF